MITRILRHAAFALCLWSSACLSSHDDSHYDPYDCGSLALCKFGAGPAGYGCFDLARDAENCGRCGFQCVQGVCVSGACVCDPGATACAWTPDSPHQCFNLETDRDSCGACYNYCGSGACVEGACQCQAGMTLCPMQERYGKFNGGCTDLQTDALNCGTCGMVCNPPGSDVNHRWCIGGQCVYPP